MTEQKNVRLQILLTETENNQYNEYCKLQDKSRNCVGREIILSKVKKWD